MAHQRPRDGPARARSPARKWITRRPGAARYLAVIVAALAVLLAVSGAAPTHIFGPDTSFATGSDGKVHIIVKYHTKPNKQQKNQMIQDLGGTVSHDYDIIPGISAAVPDAALATIQADPDVEYIEPDAQYFPFTGPNDPLYPQQWGLNNSGQSGGTAGADIHAPAAWGITSGSPSVVVAIIDTGAQADVVGAPIPGYCGGTTVTHPDLATNLWVNTGEIPGDGIDNDGDGYVDDVNGWNFADNAAWIYCSPSEDFHGTHVAGIIGGTGNNLTGVAGVNWRVHLMVLKFMDAYGGSASNAIAAIQYAQSKGAKVINASWGGGGFTATLKAAIDACGCLFVAAAGNDGVNTDYHRNYPSSFDSPNIVAVAATDGNDSLASFSNYGAASVDLGAPGVDILSTVPDGYDPSGYHSLSGTSMATPMVTGVAALLLAQNPTLTTDQLKARILNNVDPVPSLSGRTLTGGRLDAWRALANSPVSNPPPTPVALETRSAVIGSAGGTLPAAAVSPADPIDGSVMIPPGGLAANTTVTLTEFSASDPALPSPGANSLPRVIQFGPDGQALAQDATLSLMYDQSAVPPGVKEPDLAVNVLVSGTYVAVGGCAGIQPARPDPCVLSRDATANTITIRTRRLSTFALTAPTMIAFDATSLCTPGSAQTFTWAHTVGTGANRLLLVDVSIRNSGSQTVSSVTYGGLALTQVSYIANGTNVQAQMWRLLNPPSGTNNIVVTLSAATNAVCGATSWSGVNQTTPLGTAGSAYGTSTTPIKAGLVSATGQVVHDTFASLFDVPATVGAMQTERWNDAVASAVRGGGSTEPGSISVTMSWTLQMSEPWAILAVPINPAAAPPIPPALDAASTTTTTNSTTCTWSHTVGSGPDRLLLIGVSIRNSASQTVSTTSPPTWTAGGETQKFGTTPGSTTIAPYAIIANGANVRAEIWRLINPISGTGTLTVTFSAAASAVCGATSWSGVNQTTPLGTAGSAYGTSTTASKSALVSATGDVVQDVLAAMTDGTAAAGAMQTERWNGAVAGTVRGGGSTEPGAITVTMSWTLGSSQPWAILAVPIKPAATPLLAASLDAVSTATTSLSAPALDSVSTCTPGNALSFTWPHTVGTGANRFLVVGVSIRDNGSQKVSSVTYAGLPLTEVLIGTTAGGAVNGTNVRAQMWRLINPPSGTNSIVVTLSAAANAVCAATSWSGVHQTTPLGTAVSAFGTSTAPSVSVASGAGQMVHDTLAAMTDVTAAAGAGRTEQWNAASASETGTANGAQTSTTLMDSTKSWATNQFAVRSVTITGGTGAGQTRTISSNTATTLTVSTAWTTIPDGTSTYSIIPALRGAASTGAGAATVPMSWTLGSSQPWATMGVALKPANVPCSWTHTVGSGSNRLLLVSVSIRNDGITLPTVSSVTYAGLALTQVGYIANGTAVRTEMWRLINPPTGANSVAVNFSAATSAVCGATSWSGVNQTTPLGTAGSAFGTSTAPAKSALVSATGDVVEDVLGALAGSTAAAGMMQTERWNTSASSLLAGSSTELGSVSVTMSWTLGSSQPWAILAVPIKPVAAPPPTSPTLDAQSSTTTALSAPVLDSGSNCTPGNALSFTWPHTVGTGANRFLVVGVSIRDNGSQAVSSVTYAGLPLTEVLIGTTAGGAVNGTNVRAQMWRLINPPSGTNNIVVTLSAAANAVCAATSWSGVHQTTPLGTAVSAYGTSTAPSVSVASGAGQMVHDTLAAMTDVTAAAGAGRTEQWNASSASETGTANGAQTSTTLMDSTKSWATNQFAVRSVTITGGTGAGQTRTISSNTATTLTVSTAWTTIPDGTSTYSIIPALRGAASTGAGAATVPMSWTLGSSQPWATMGVALKPANVPCSWTHTVGSGSNRLLLVSVSIRNDGITLPTVSSVTYAGLALTQVGYIANGTAVRTEMWRLINPPTGANSVAVNFSAATSAVCGATSWSGVNQTTPLGTAGTAYGTGTVASKSALVSATGQVVEDVLGAVTDGTAAVGSMQTEVWNSAVAGAVRGGSSTEPGAVSVTTSWTLASSQPWATMAVPIQPAAAPPTPPALDAASTAAATNSTTCTWSHTVGSGPNRLLLVGVSIRKDGVTLPTVSSVKYAGLTLTQVGYIANGLNTRAEMWRLINPPSGTDNVVVTFSAATNAACGATSWSGVNQTTPLGTAGSAYGTGTTASKAGLVSATGDVVQDVLAAVTDGTAAAGSMQTERWNGAVAGVVRGGGSTEPGSISVTASWTLGSSQPWAILAVPIKPA